MSNPLPRILFLVAQPFFRWRGSPIRVAYDLSALAESGYSVDLLTLPIGEPISIPGIRILRVGNPLRIRDIPIGPSPAKLFFDLLIAVHGRRLIREHQYAAIHGIEECGAIACRLARYGGTRAVYEKHSDPASHRGHPLRNALLGLYAGVERYTVRRADMVIGTGPGLVEQARQMGCRVPCHHIPDLPSSRVEADPEAVVRERAQTAVGPESVLAVYVGSFAGYQGMDLLFDAIPQAVRDRQHLRFIIIGGSPRQIAQRRQQMTAAGCAAAVRFTGPVSPDRLPAMLAAADILISPRIAGANTPLKLLDYLKAGRAIIATDLPANRQILDDECALFVGTTPLALADGIQKLCDHPEARQQLGDAGRVRARERYGYERFRDALAAAYSELMEHHHD